MFVHTSQLAGLGDADSTAAQVTSAGGTVAAGAITTAATSGAIAASTAAIAIPVIGAVVIGVTLWLTSISRKNAQKTAATHIVDDIEPKLKQNLDGYVNGPRTPESQAQALANFDTAWQIVLQNCGQPQLGSAGQRCIDERKEGGTAPWCPTPDQKGCDWFTLYRLPIEQNPPTQTAAAAASGYLAQAGITGNTLLWLASAVISVVALID